MQEASTVRVYPGLENDWIGYEQLAGSRYVSTKRAELEVICCLRGCHVYKDRWAAAVEELWQALKSPPTWVSGNVAVINKRNNH